jgi:hypothetical protein
MARELNVQWRSGCFDWVHPDARSLFVRVQVPDFEISLTGLAPGEPSGSTPWPDIAEAAAREVCSWFLTTQRADAEKVLAWLAVDENHDALYHAWAKSRRVVLLRQRRSIDDELARIHSAPIETPAFGDVP